MLIIVAPLEYLTNQMGFDGISKIIYECDHCGEEIEIDKDYHFEDQLELFMTQNWWEKVQDCWYCPKCLEEMNLDEVRRY